MISVVDLRSGDEIPEIVQPFAFELARAFGVPAAPGFPPPGRPAIQGGAALGRPQMLLEPRPLAGTRPPAVVATGRLTSVDRSIVEPHTEDYEITGGLELRVQGDPCGGGKLQSFDLQAKGRGHFYHQAMADLSAKLLREFKKAVAERALGNVL
jgi:hypothetical protein